jgi:starch synthase
VATGIQFTPVTAERLAKALSRLCDLHADAEVFARMQRQGMKQPVGWTDSAAEYAALYEGMISPT